MKIKCLFGHKFKMCRSELVLPKNITGGFETEIKELVCIKCGKRKIEATEQTSWGEQQVLLPKNLTNLTYKELKKLSLS